MAGKLRRFLLRLALEEAIRREEKAYRFYESAREAVQDQQAAGLLRRLCAEELRHRLKLEDLQRSGELAQAGAVEAESEQAELPADPGPEWPAVTGALEPPDVWAVALRKERQARDYYRLLAHRAPLASFREVFAFLEAEEQRHVDWVQAALQTAGGTGA
jgi:rubrerythrin